MEDLKRHEEMEMLVLEGMRRERLLDQVIFGGGTMLRLCFDLPRYSVDLDFYILKSPGDFKPWALRLTQLLKSLGATMTDQQEKHYTWLWEIKLPSYPHKLKLEIRKSTDEVEETEIGIAHSPFSNSQVRLRVVTLRQMWRNKVKALVDRRAIRDAYDLEFLTLRNVGEFETLDSETVAALLKRLDSFSEQDFKSTLASLLQKEEKKRVLESRFSYLRAQINAAFNRK